MNLKPTTSMDVQVGSFRLNRQLDLTVGPDAALKPLAVILTALGPCGR
jgi:hypothetical protein